MKEYATYLTARVLFNQTHWVSGEVMKVYLHYLHLMYPNERIALVIDMHSAHIGDEYTKSLTSVNNLCNPMKKIDTFYIPEGMTAVLQVGDVAVNKLLKAKIRTIFYKNLYATDPDLNQDNHEMNMYSPIQPRRRKKIKITRQQFISIVEEAHVEINNENQKKRWIERAAQQCNQHPYHKDSKVFHDYLERLDQTSIEELTCKSFTPTFFG
jgi:hypothetical protein